MVSRKDLESRETMIRAEKVLQEACLKALWASCQNALDAEIELVLTLRKVRQVRRLHTRILIKKHKQNPGQVLFI